MNQLFENEMFNIYYKKQTNKQSTNLINYQLLTESEMSVIINWMKYNENKITN